jgi:hypothetical protein
MGKKAHLNQPLPDKGSRIKPDGREVGSTDAFPPIFALKTVKGWSVSDCIKDEKARFASKLHDLSQSVWSELEGTDHTSGQGCETIPRKSIKGSGVPNYITKDVENFIVFRCGLKFRIVGFRSMQVFNIVWLDRNHQLY